MSYRGNFLLISVAFIDEGDDAGGPYSSLGDVGKGLLLLCGKKEELRSAVGAPVEPACLPECYHHN